MAIARAGSGTASTADARPSAAVSAGSSWSTEGSGQSTASRDEGEDKVLKCIVGQVQVDELMARRELFELDNGDDPIEWSFTAMLDPYLITRVPHVIEQVAHDLVEVDGVVAAQAAVDRLHIATEGIDFTGVDEALTAALRRRLSQIDLPPA